MQRKGNCLAALILFLWISSSYAQPLLRVISIKGKASLNGSALAIDQLLTDDKAQLVAHDKNGYVGVLSADGFVYKSSRGKYLVSDIVKKIEVVRKNTLFPPPPPFVHDGPQYDDIKWILTPGSNYIKNDSVLLRWKSVRGKSKFTLSLTNIFEDKLFDTTLSVTRIKLHVRNFLKENRAVLVTVRSEKEQSGTEFLKLLEPNEVQNVDTDLSHIPKDHPQKIILTMAILELNNLYLDLITELYKYSKLNVENAPADLQAFIARAKKSYLIE